MFPIKNFNKNRLGYTHGVPTFYSDFHLGYDYIINGIPLFMAGDGDVIYKPGKDSGECVWVRFDFQPGLTHRFMHNKKGSIKTGRLKEGQQFAISDNTGKSTTPHVHHDTYIGLNPNPLDRKNFVDPLKLNWETMTTTKVSLYKSNISKPEIVSAGIDYLNSLLPPEFNLITNVFVTDWQFNTITDGTKTWVAPDQILQLPIDGKVVCLVHTVPEVTNPFHNPIQKDGCTPIQIPEKWFGDSKEVFAEFYLHELLHAWCYLLGQPDKVHAPGPNWGGYDSPIKYYISLLLELKPHWPKLASEEKGEPMIIIHKKSDPKTKFAITSDVKNGFVDQKAFDLQTAGRTIVDVALDDTEFDKIPRGANFKS